ncbi:hypothetical protein [Xanthobacter aminoxidans]|uniref:hypothetical protein n=1 Tax=Xanthobacter aminoxidans TaxID=186280 RepID=UPI00202303CC|nr:hypothetical protein [Xanthobacter aminoxidans]MCL8381773.1 hypothetical protein [Xanthobacter aminoxidans]
MAWLDTCDLAAIAGISRQKAHRALQRVHRDPVSLWRGATLVVRTVRGRGGRSGLCYEVLVSSLPPDLQERLRVLSGAYERPLSDLSTARDERNWWSIVLAPAAAQPKFSRERGAAVADIIGRTHVDWQGRPFQPSRKTVERKLAAYELHGAAGLCPQARRDKNTRRVVISKPWDTAAPLDLPQKERIAHELRQHIRGLYKDGASAKIIGALASDKLRVLSALAGWDRPPAAALAVPRRFIEAEATFRKVAIFNKDRKAHEDARPRVRRTRDGLAPMDTVFGDVHHLDIVMRREDGTEAWPKAIAWQDSATNRVRFDLVLLEKGKNVRNADLIRSFVAMTQDPAWGVPRGLYFDNGKEYLWADFMDDAMKLVERVMVIGGDDSSHVTRARPYNAQAKPIEGLFGVLEQRYFRTIQGWVGGDRMNKTTAKVGRPTEPFSGTLDDLRAIIAGSLAVYESLPQKGALKGRSPRAAYNEALAGGWQRIDVDARQLHTVFATTQNREVRQGCISFGGQRWTCDELTTYLSARVSILVPKFESPSILPLLDEKGNVFGFAHPERDYALLDRAGARESSRRDRLHKSAIRQLDQIAPDVDTTAEVMRLAATLPPAAPAPIAATLSISTTAAEIAQGLAELPEERQARIHSQKEREHRERTAQLEAAHKRIMGGRA